MPAAAAAAKPVPILEPIPEVTSVPVVTTIRIRNDFDDLAVRPDGAFALATQANSRYTDAPARPAASVARFGPLGVQLPTLTPLASSPRVASTQSAVTDRGSVVAWATRAKHPVAWVSEMADDGVAAAPQRLSAPGLSGWPVEAASGGEAVGVLLDQYRSGRRASERLRLAYRAPGAEAFSTVAVPARRVLFDYDYRLAIGPAGDGAIAAWSNEQHSASLWRIARDGSVGPEMPVDLGSKGYTDAQLAVGGDGTIGATFGVSVDRGPDRVEIVEVPAGANALAPGSRIRASGGGSLSTQGVGLAVSPTGRLLVAVADGGNTQVIVEGSGRAFTQSYAPYISGGTAAAAWMPDGRAVVVLESVDPSTYPEVTRLFSFGHEPGRPFGAPRQIGPELTAGGELPTFRELVPAPDGSAVLAWEIYDGHRGRLSVARIRP